jgi:hypothetical protein
MKMDGNHTKTFMMRFNWNNFYHRLTLLPCVMNNTRVYLFIFIFCCKLTSGNIIIEASEQSPEATLIIDNYEKNFYELSKLKPSIENIRKVLTGNQERGLIRLVAIRIWREKYINEEDYIPVLEKTAMAIKDGIERIGEIDPIAPLSSLKQRFDGYNGFYTMLICADAIGVKNIQSALDMYIELIEGNHDFLRIKMLSAERLLKNKNSFDVSHVIIDGIYSNNRIYREMAMDIITRYPDQIKLDETNGIIQALTDQISGGENVHQEKVNAMRNALISIEGEPQEKTVKVGLDKDGNIEFKVKKTVK